MPYWYVKTFPNQSWTAAIHLKNKISGMMVATLRRSSRGAQYFMRGRVVAQGFTVAALVGGAVMFGIGAPTEAALRAPGKGQANIVSLTPPPAVPQNNSA